jgi:hypothetical protein
MWVTQGAANRLMDTSSIRGEQTKRPKNRKDCIDLAGLAEPKNLQMNNATCLVTLQ